MAAIFISYRRSDGGDAATHLYGKLVEGLGRSKVFMDVNSIEPGLDFEDALKRVLGKCDVLIALITDDWRGGIVPPSEEEARRKYFKRHLRKRYRIDDVNDFVHREIATALARNIRVVPVLLGRESMPDKPQLPLALGGLAKRQAIDARQMELDEVARVIVRLTKKKTLLGAVGRAFSWIS